MVDQKSGQQSGSLPKAICCLNGIPQDVQTKLVLKMVERQIIQSKDLPPIFTIQTRRRIRSIHWIRHKGQILAALRGFRPVRDVRV